jgi:hypothetical protein
MDGDFTTMRKQLGALIAENKARTEEFNAGYKAAEEGLSLSDEPD